MIIGKGFGNFSHLIPGWNDAPAGAGLPLDAGIGTEIDGGSTGAILTALTVEFPFWQPAGSNAPAPFRILILASPRPFLFTPWQYAWRGWPLLGDSSQPIRTLWSKIFAQKTNPNSYADANNEQRSHFPFRKRSGPSVGPGETMTILYFLMRNFINDFAGDNIHYGNNPGGTLLGFTALGVYGPVANAARDRNSIGRSIPRGRLSGV